MVCDTQTSLVEARSQWWICTTCGSYICPNCRTLFLETGQNTCPGAIIQGSEPHSPHFTRFLGPRDSSEVTELERSSSVTILADVPRRRVTQPSGKVVILPDEEGPESSPHTDSAGPNDDE